MKGRAFTLCEETGMRPADGACPSHGGDACLRDYIPAPRVREAWAAAERLQGALDAGALVPSDADEAPAAGLLRRDLESLIELADAACACGGAHYCAAEVTEAAAAARTLVNEHNLGDFVYNVRDRALNDRHYDGNTWDHPLVTSFARAVEKLRAFGESVTFSGPAPAPVPPTHEEELLDSTLCPDCGRPLGIGLHLPTCPSLQR